MVWATIVRIHCESPILFGLTEDHRIIVDIGVEEFAPEREEGILMKLVAV